MQDIKLPKFEFRNSSTINYPKHYHLPSDPYQRYPGYNRKPFPKEESIEDLYMDYNHLSMQEKLLIESQLAIKLSEKYYLYNDDAELLSKDNISPKFERQFIQGLAILNGNAKAEKKSDTKYRYTIYKNYYIILTVTSGSVVYTDICVIDPAYGIKFM